MNDDVIIRAEGLGKKYVIDHQAEREHYLALRDVIARVAKNAPRKTIDIFRGRFPERNGSKEEFWALKDVSFEVKRGEVLGIIGRNGAGKSTLLKILSRITEPTEGRVTIKGRVASLLEVGTGFHQELTGRENIFLNGAILGMPRTEIRRKFDEIVAFAGVEKFLDTPVKRYSSGMYVRLAFAVAAHLEPEILIVDEVLAVGDAEFQKRCLNKMDEVANGGRTVLFVTHNLDAMQRLCKSGMILERGSLVDTSRDISHLISKYTRNSDGGAIETIWRSSSRGPRLRHFIPHSLSVNCSITPTDQPTAVFPRKDPIFVTLTGDCVLPHPQLTIGFALYNEAGNLLFWSYPTDAGTTHEVTLRSGRVQMRAIIPGALLNRGRYRIELIGGIHGIEWHFAPNSTEICVWFEIGGEMSSSPFWVSPRPGLLAPVIPWSISAVEETVA